MNIQSDAFLLVLVGCLVPMLPARSAARCQSAYPCSHIRAENHPLFGEVEPAVYSTKRIECYGNSRVIHCNGNNSSESTALHTSFIGMNNWSPPLVSSPVQLHSPPWKRSIICDNMISRFSPGLLTNDSKHVRWSNQNDWQKHNDEPWRSNFFLVGVLAMPVVV